MKKLLNRLSVLSLVAVTATASTLALVACGDDEEVTPGTSDSGTADSTTPTGDATTDDDGSVPSDRGNIVFNVAYAGASKGALTCLVIGDLGPAAQKNVTAPVYPQKVEANNIKPGDYKAVCYIDANGNEQADDLDPKGPPGPPRTVTVKAGETTTEDIVVNDPEPETDAGTDAGDAGDAGDGAP